MKVTKTLLKQFINEEINRALKEDDALGTATTPVPDTVEALPRSVEAIRRQLSSLPDLQKLFKEINTKEEIIPLIVMILKEVDESFLEQTGVILQALRDAVDQAAN